MKLFVAITFKRKLYVKNGFVERHIEYFAKRYHSTGSVVWCKKADPSLYCECTEDDLRQLAIDIEPFEGAVKFEVFTNEHFEKSLREYGNWQ